MADEFNSQLDRHIKGLAALQQAEVARLEDLRQLVKIQQEGVKRVEGAIRALTGEPKPAPSPTRRKRQVKPPASANIERVLRAVENFSANGGGTLHHVMDDTGLSSDTVRRAFHVLREREQIRKAGVVAGTTTPLYKTMTAE